MFAHYLKIILRTISVFLGGSVLLMLQGSGRLEAQSTPPFLISPYYGTVVITNGYSGSHPAYDYGLNYVHMLAVASGVIERVRWYSNAPECHGPTNDPTCGYGLHIYIQHDNGYVTRYAHLSSSVYAIGTSGTAVQSGQVIGASGNTGWSTGPHLHFEVKNEFGGAVDPYNPSLWKDGQWASPSRSMPEPVNGGEIQVDDTTNNSGGFSKGSGGVFQNVCTGDCGGWSSATAGVGGHMYHTAADGGTINQWAMWAPSGLDTGSAIYEVFVHVPNSNATSWQAPYVISHAEGVNAGVVDQLGLNNQWVSIGAYRMGPGHYVWTHDASGEAYNQHCVGTYCRLGVDAVKFVRRGTIYLPDIRSDGGWSSQLFLRNDGGGYARTVVKFLRGDGSIACTVQPALFAHQSVALNCNDSQVATAVVDSSQNLSAVVSVRNSSDGRAALNNGVLPASAGDPAFEQAAGTLYAPAFYRAIYGDTNSTIDLFNPSAQGTSVTFEFRGRSGYSDPPTVAYWAAAGGRLRIEATTVPISPWVGSVRIVAGQPVVATVNERNASFERSFNAAAAGSWLQYVPAAYKNAWNLTTGLLVQNVGSSTINVTFTFCERLVTNPNTCPTYTHNNLAPLRAIGLNLENVGALPSGWSGSVKITSSDNATPLVTVVNNGLKDASGALVDGYNFNASNYGGRWVYLPYAARNADGRSTGFTLRNVSGGNISGNAHYYDQDGTLRISYPFTLASAQVIGRAQVSDALPAGWVGSILLAADGPILAIMREDAPNRSAGYNGLVLAP